MLIGKAKYCFVLMPFSDDLKSVYWNAIKPACDQTGFKSLRVDELKGPLNIHREIIQHIFNSNVIIADLTNWNPNVFYEMGVAHAIDNKTIMIIQKKDKLPFDVNTYNCIIYEQTDNGLQLLTQRLIEFLQHFDDWRSRPTNPAQDFKPSAAFVPRKEMEALQKELAQKKTEIASLLSELKHSRSKLIIPKKSIKSKPSLLLRSLPISGLFVEEVQKILKEKDFFDSRLNEHGKGIQHKYEMIDLHGVNVVIDQFTGLIWQQSGSSELNLYPNAEKYIHDLNMRHFAGYNDWRLPTLEEAMSLMKPEQNNGLYLDLAFDRRQQWIWTTDKEGGDDVWVVFFNLGRCIPIPGEGHNYCIRAVRT